MLKRILFAVLCAALAATCAAQTAYPGKPIRFIVPYPPGGFTDILARLISQKLTDRWSQPVLVENRGGGGSTIGTDLAAKAPPDGYTILIVAPDLAINTSLYAKLPYDAVADFAPVTLVAWGPIVLVAHPSVPAGSVKELIALARSRPAQINYASGGNGTGGHLAMELFKTRTATNLVHVPYKGIGPAASDLLAGQVSVMFLQIAVARPHVLAGKLRALAIGGSRRSQAMPDVPTVAESGVSDFDVTPWFGVVAPARTPQDVVAKLSAEIGRIMQLADVKDRLVSQGADPVSTSPGEFAAFIKSEIGKWADVVRKSGARVD